MRQVAIQEAFDLARSHHQAGRLAEAEQLYRQVLARQPHHADALHLLGMLNHQAGQNAIGVELLRQAIALNPESPLVHYNLANALKSDGKLDEAVVAYRQAIHVRPDYAAAYNNLGIALNLSGQLQESLVAFRRAASLRPDHAASFSNLGDALKGVGELDEAIEAYRRAITLRPDYAEAHNNLGNALRHKGQLDEALAEYKTAIGLRPNCGEYLSNLGNAFKDMGQLNDAAAAYQKAIALAPDYHDAHYNLGNVLKDAGQFDEAIGFYRQAIALRPTCPKSHYNLGNALKDTGRLKAAIDEYRQAIALAPDLPEAGDNLIYAMQFHPASDARTIAEEQRRWNHRHAELLRQCIQHHRNNRDPDWRLRIGYVSPDFREHCQSLFMLPLLSSHDRRQVEVFCYSDVRRPDARTQKLCNRTDVWREITGQSDEQVAALIRQDQIDILVDLTMHMAGNRLLMFARKPAPVQVTWLAYPGSTGLTAINYRLSDPYLDPVGMDESIYSEKTIRLPDSFWCYDPLDGRDIPVNALPALSLSNRPALPALSAVEGSLSNAPAAKNGHVTFGCLNNACKINDAVLDLWSQVLIRVKNSRLLLLTAEGTHRQHTLDRLARQGIEPDRVEFAPPRPRKEYLELYHHIDVGLDTFPYNGHTTSLDAFWMGVPVVTLVGQTAVARAGWCQLSNLGLPELAAATPQQFVQIAVELAANLPRLAELRATIRGLLERSPLMDAPKFARNIEAAYRKMWRAWCESGLEEKW
jgi:protein O-GlcNAc transferase